MPYWTLVGVLANFPLAPVGNLCLSRKDWSWSLEISLPPVRPASLPSLWLCFLSCDSERCIYSLLPEPARRQKHSETFPIGWEEVMTFTECSMLLSGLTLLLLSFSTQHESYDKMRARLGSSRPQWPCVSQALLRAFVFLSTLGNSWTR